MGDDTFENVALLIHEFSENVVNGSNTSESFYRRTTPVVPNCLLYLLQIVQTISLCIYQ